MNNHITVLAGAWALGFTTLVHAQTGNADPSQPRQPAAQLRYDSAFANYKPWQDTKPGDWRAINDALLKGPAQAGAHAGHGAAPSAAKSADPAASTPAAKPAAAASAAPSGGHGAHGSHK